MARLDDRIKYYENYFQRQMQVPGGRINQQMFDILSGSGNVRLGEGWNPEERKRLENRLKDDRARRQSLKRLFEIAEKQNATGYMPGNNQNMNRASLTGSEAAAVPAAALGASTAIGAAGGAATASAFGGLGASGVAVAGGIGAAGGALVALPAALLAAAVLGPIAASQKSQAKKQRDKIRAIGAASEVIANTRGTTASGALLSREGAMRIARSQARNKTTT